MFNACLAIGHRVHGGDLSRNRGDHLQALHIWLEALRSWQQVHALYAHPQAVRDWEIRRKELGLGELGAQWKAELRRKAAEMARRLAPRCRDRRQNGIGHPQSRLHSGGKLPGVARIRYPGASYGRIQWLDER